MFSPYCLYVSIYFSERIKYCPFDNQQQKVGPQIHYYFLVKLLGHGNNTHFFNYLSILPDIKFWAKQALDIDIGKIMNLGRWYILYVSFKKGLSKL